MKSLKQLMKKKSHAIISMTLTVSMSVFALLFTSCDEHEVTDTNIYPGHILCDDGRIISEAEYERGHYTPVGVVFASKTSEHEALVVMLKEYKNLEFSLTLDYDQGTSCSETAYDGYLNTIELQSHEYERSWLDEDSVMQYEYKYSPMARIAFASHYYHQSDYVPSVAEMGALYLVKDKVNPILYKCGGDTLVSNVSDGRGCWYWTSTECKENKANQSWLFSMADGSRHRTPKTNAYKVRLIVEYNSLNVK